MNLKLAALAALLSIAGGSNALAQGMAVDLANGTAQVAPEPPAEELSPVSGTKEEAVPKDAMAPAPEAEEADKKAEATDASAAKATTAPATEGTAAAEMAIVNNASVLNTMSPVSTAAPAPGGRGLKVTDILTQPANIRPLPEQYLVVKKNHNADEASSRLTAARIALSQGNYQAALQLFNDLYRENPRDIRPAMGRAVALQKLGQADEALMAYQAALSADPRNVEAITNMLGLIRGQDANMAVEKLGQLRDMYPANADITAQLGMVYGAAGDYENAIKYLNMADALKPGSAIVMYNKAVAYDRMGKTAEAAELYRKVVMMGGEGTLDQHVPLDAVRKRLAVLR